MKKLLVILLIISVVRTTAQESSPKVSTVSTDGTLTVSVTTSSAGGGFYPDNVLAIWVQDNASKLVNTMMYYTSNSHSSAVDMSTWYQRIGSHWSTNATTLATYTLKNVDGISGATQKSESAYGLRTCYWGKTVSLASVADGIYTVGMELCDDVASVNSAGHSFSSFSFTKGPVAQTLTPANAPSFSNISIQWVPKSSAGIQDVKLESQYSVYPNPAKSIVHIGGSDIQKIVLCTLSGKQILTSSLSKIDISKLPVGNYLAKISTKRGTFVKKIEKQ